MNIKQRFDASRLAARYGARFEAGKYELDPLRFYPTTIARIRAAVLQGGLPEDLIDREPAPGVDPELAARRYLAWASRITEQAWLDALTPRARFHDEERVKARAEALECARLWFTRAAKNLFAPIFIHIARDERFRL